MSETRIHVPPDLTEERVEQIDDAIQKVIPDEAASRRGKSRLPGASV